MSSNELTHDSLEKSGDEMTPSWTRKTMAFAGVFLLTSLGFAVNAAPIQDSPSNDGATGACTTLPLKASYAIANSDSSGGLDQVAPPSANMRLLVA